jgi:ribosome maturation factor RimP
VYIQSHRKWVDKPTFLVGRFEMEKRKAEIKKVITAIVEAAGAFLVDFNLNFFGKRTFMRVVVETISGISLDEITAITRKINADTRLDQLIDPGYQLEVTSPGDDYPLKEYRDFPRNVSRRLKVFHKNPEMESPLEGQLVEVSEEKLLLDLHGVTQEIRFCDLKYAKVVLKW